MSYLTEKPLLLNELLNEIRSDESGAEVVFQGMVRNYNEGKPVVFLEYETYPPLAERVIREIVQETYLQWNLQGISLKHRLGRLKIGEISIIICVSSAHRENAFIACRYLIDQIKLRVPNLEKRAFCGLCGLESGYTRSI